jgi:hypothetical protein
VANSCQHVDMAAASGCSASSSQCKKQHWEDIVAAASVTAVLPGAHYSSYAVRWDMLMTAAASSALCDHAHASLSSFASQLMLSVSCIRMHALQQPAADTQLQLWAGHLRTSAVEPLHLQRH